jgi:hypothetical protein
LDIRERKRLGGTELGYQPERAILELVLHVTVDPLL